MKSKHKLDSIINEMKEKQRHKVKMKPSSAHRWNIPILVLVLLLVSSTIIQLCDSSTTTSSSSSISIEAHNNLHARSMERQVVTSGGGGTSYDETNTDTDQQHRVHEMDKSSSFNGPKFDAQQEWLVVASRWQNEVFLPCKILNLDEEQTVSWIRKRDSLVLTIDKLRLIDDPRFQLAQSNQDWTLILSQPNSLDAGFYECQVSSMEPKLSKLIELRIVEANSHISNFTSLFVRPNEQLNVTCTIESPQRTDFVYWYKNKEPIQFDNIKLRYPTATHGSRSSGPTTGDTNDSDKLAYIRRSSRQSSLSSSSVVEPTSRSSYSVRRKVGSVSYTNSIEDSSPLLSKITDRQDKTSSSSTKRRQEDTIKLVRSSSSLIIKQTKLNDTANYTCLPSNAKPSHISIIVIENGVQSQPEKRSLQAADSACSYKSSLMRESWLLVAKLVKLKLIKILPTWLNILFGSDCGFKNVIQHGFTSKEEQSILSLLVKLIWSQDFHRLMVTVTMTFYTLRGLS